MNASTADLDVASFVNAAKDRGLPDTTILAILRNGGWSERRAIRALASYYARADGLDIPGRSDRAEYAREAFLYLLNFITLGFWITAFGQIWYTLIAHWFPDPAIARYESWNLMQMLSWQIATVAVAFPIFAFVHYLIRKTLASRPELYDSGVRKWLTYIALVIAAVIVIADGVWFVNAFLRGELSTRFMLDELVLFVLGGGVFGYYLATIDPPAATA
jgi:hypothetical protein